MSILSVTEDLPSGAGEITNETRSFTRHFIVETDSYADNAITVINAPGIPRIYSVFAKGNDVDGRSVCLSLRPRRDPKAPLIWRVVARYEKWNEEDNEEEPNELTIERTLPQFNILQEEYQEIITRDRDGKAIRNKADDWFSPMPEITKTRRIYVLTRMFRKYEDYNDKGKAWRNKLNENVVWGIEAEKLLSVGLGPAVRHTDDWGTYWETTQSFRHQEEGFTLKLENMGFNEKVNQGVGTGLRRIRDEDGQFVTEPAFLNASGKKLHVSQQPTDPLEFEIFPLLNFNVMNLPPLDVSYLPWN